MKLPAIFRRNGKALPAPPERKAAVEFFSPDGMRSVVRILGGALSDVDEVTRYTAFGAAVYAYAAMVWRADKYSEPALMVVEVTDEEETKLDNHPLNELLDMPSPDYDMGELLYITRLYRDTTGAALWVKDGNLAGQLGRLTPFNADEFRVERSRDRLFGRFTVKTEQGEKILPAERVVFWREIGASAWGSQAPLDVALQNLNLGQRAVETVKQILKNALFPSVVIQADKEWNPDEIEFLRWRSSLDAYAETNNKGKPLALLGGGSATVVGMTLKDLLPDAIMDRVEANVAAAFRVPAVVLQFLVGLKNSPWSQMAEARRMAYEDTLQPMWRRDQKKLNHQLLHSALDEQGQILDADLTHAIRFDTSDISALQQDRLQLANISNLVKDIAKRNERRVLAGFDPLPDDDPRGDEIASGGPAVPDPNAEPDPQQQDQQTRRPPPKRPPPPPPEEDQAGKSLHDLAWLEFDVETKAQEPHWSREVDRLLSSQKKRVQQIAERTLKEVEGKLTSESVSAFLGQAEKYVTSEAAAQLKEGLEPLISSTATQAVERTAAKLGLSFDLLEPSVERYVRKETMTLVTGVTKTTQKDLRELLAAAVRDGESVSDAGKTLSEAHAFSRARGRLIARSETTRATNASRRESLSDFARENGATIEKTWVNSGDDRVRDEHLDQSEGGVGGETVGIDEEFSNGLQEPSEPNCRCTLVFSLRS